VWQETEKALRETGASVFFQVLRDCGALKIRVSEINALFGVPQPEKWHPEIDTGVHTLMVLDQAVRLSADTKVRFAALLHDLGKGTTPHSEWPGHKGHEERSVALIDLCAIGSSCRASIASSASSWRVITATCIVRLSCVQHNFGNPGKDRCVRRPERFAQALLACEADSRGRLGLEEDPYPQRPYLQAGARCRGHDQADARGYRGSGRPVDCRTHSPAAAAAITELTSSRPAMQ